MKLRHRLHLFSTAQLLVFGALFAVAFWSFEHSVLPMFEGLLRDKSQAVARLLSGELDVPLAADDANLMAQELRAIEADPDFLYVVVRDAKGKIVTTRGVAPSVDPFAGAANRPSSDGDGIATWAPISIEGLSLGSVAVVFSTSRVATLETWTTRLSFAVAVFWLCALAYSIAFSRAFVAPIHAMMDFSRKVAGGALSGRLDISAEGELLELRDYLNEMTANLERREQARKAADAQAAEMQKELLAVTRMAGMAEIATGVLHNVGNVLNSLNVSVSMIDDQVRNSKIAALSKSVELFDGYPGGLSAFLGTDRGKVLPGYLATVSKRLVEENSTVLGELASVSRNVEHIKSIVAMQQSYARPTGISEVVGLTTLLDDALRLGESSFNKHNIKVVKDYGEGVSVVTDRHKLLQILINLVSNARHAMKDSGKPDQRLTVTTRETPTGVSIAIADTGVGIPPENIAKLFQHGFTTKKGGHGFGLHSSAIAARELGGTLTPQSDGVGMGATFTLEIPTEPRSNDARHN